MIRLVEKEEQQRRLLALCEKTAFGCKIASLALAYGFDKGFACFWLDDQDQVVYCLADGVMLLSGTVVQEEQARSFLRAVGPQEVFCAVRNAEALGLAPLETGTVLKKLSAPGAKAPEPEGEPGGIREIYGLLEDVGMAPEFEPFYLDLSHKLRHGQAWTSTRRDGQGLTGCALVSAVTKGSVVLSAVAVREDCRRQGMGSALVKEAEGAFPGKTVYVFREQGKNKEFYWGLGYLRADTWVRSQL